MGVETGVGMGTGIGIGTGTGMGTGIRWDWEWCRALREGPLSFAQIRTSSFWPRSMGSNGFLPDAEQQTTTIETYLLGCAFCCEGCCFF